MADRLMLDWRPNFPTLDGLSIELRAEARELALMESSEGRG